MVGKLIIFYSDIELEDSFIKKWKYIIKNHNKLKEIPTLLENEMLVLQSVKQMFYFEQISNPTEEFRLLTCWKWSSGVIVGKDGTCVFHFST